MAEIEGNESNEPKTIVNAVYSLWDSYWYAWTLRDPKVDGFPLVGCPFPTLLICFLYMLMVRYIIPDLMIKRSPVYSSKVLATYNFCMVIVNIWLHYEFWMAGWGTGYSFLCESIDYNVNPKTMRMANLMWWYFISKFIDMFDTIFITLRKQQDKISFLHFFHHITMPFNAWVLIRFIPGGHCTFHGLLNSFVHTLMYFYYGLSALGTDYRKYLWWKKYVTLSQLIQFYLDAIHLALPYFFECNYPRSVLSYMLLQVVFFMLLFTDFYLRAYVVGKKRKSSVNGN